MNNKHIEMYVAGLRIQIVGVVSPEGEMYRLTLVRESTLQFDMIKRKLKKHGWVETMYEDGIVFALLNFTNLQVALHEVNRAHDEVLDALKSSEQSIDAKLEILTSLIQFRIDSLKD